jgi:hypothetical protein
MHNNLAGAQRRNILIFAILVLLSIGELIVATTLEGSIVPLMLLIVVKAALIVQYFMHVYRLWRQEGHS